MKTNYFISMGSDEISGILSRAKASMHQADFNNAESLYLEVVELTHNNRAMSTFTAEALHFLGDISRLKGDPNQAILYYQQAVDYTEDPRFISHLKEDIGVILVSLNKISDGLDLVSQSLTFLRKQSDFTSLNDVARISATYFKLIRIHLLRDETEIAKQLFQEIKRYISGVREFEFLKNRVTFHNALLLKKSGRIKDLGRAQVLFEEVVEVALDDVDTRIGAVKELIELLILEYRTVKDIEVLGEVTNYLNLIFEISSKHGLLGNIVEVLVYKSRLALVEVDFDKSQEYLLQAQLFAESNGLDNYLQLVKHELQNIKAEFGSLHRSVIDSKLSDISHKEKIIDYIQFSKSMLATLQDEDS